MTGWTMETRKRCDPALRAEIAGMLPVRANASPYRRIAATLGDVIDGETYVHLRRIDRVRSAVSGFVAEQTGLWRAIPGVGEHTPLKEPEFEFAANSRRIAVADRAHAHWTNLFAALGVTPIALTYEALTRHYQDTVAGVLRALGSRAAPPAPRMQRQSDERSEDFARRYLREAQARFVETGTPA